MHSWESPHLPLVQEKRFLFYWGSDGSAKTPFKSYHSYPICVFTTPKVKSCSSCEIMGIDGILVPKASQLS